MLDKKIYTFMKLCERMNYRETAEELHMTQPAVTQQIQSLEREYDCKLFLYRNRSLEKTKQAVFLENICRSSYYNEQIFKKYLTEPQKLYLRIGATKTIGDYVISDKIISLAADDNIILSVYVENTQNLLDLLDQAKIDFAIVEGPFDKCKYDATLMKKERFLGVCAKDHPFAGKTVSFEDMVDEKIILREEGSGTREIFEQTLAKSNYGIDYFHLVSSSSSFEMIKKIVATSRTITFAYEDIAKSDDKLATFQFTEAAIYGEFNYIYLKNSLSKALVDKFM